ncbi:MULTISPECIES: hypothetical protein [unclassified Curtobacterium]|uniref:hypothetical protein n=1 Tax=unclassified Curtobacterium TaxID=257496 RepID=UPI0038204B30
MSASRVRVGIVASALSAVLLAGMAAAPASAAPAPNATGSFEVNCGSPGGGAKVSWERNGTTYRATIDQYRLTPAHGDTNTNGEVTLQVNGGAYVQKTKLTSDGGWHALGAVVTANVPSGASIENVFTFVYQGFPSYPSCTATKWL